MLSLLSTEINNNLDIIQNIVNLRIISSLKIQTQSQELNVHRDKFYQMEPRPCGMAFESRFQIKESLFKCVTGL